MVSKAQKKRALRRSRYASVKVNVERAATDASVSATIPKDSAVLQLSILEKSSSVLPFQTCYSQINPPDQSEFHGKKVTQYEVCFSDDELVQPGLAMAKSTLSFQRTPGRPEAIKRLPYLKSACAEGERIEYVEPTCSAKCVGETAHANKAASSVTFSHDNSLTSEGFVLPFQTCYSELNHASQSEFHVNKATHDEVCFSDELVQPGLAMAKSTLSSQRIPEKPEAIKRRPYLKSACAKGERVECVEPICSAMFVGETAHHANKVASSVKFSNDNSLTSGDLCSGFENLEAGESRLIDCKHDEVRLSDDDVPMQVELAMLAASTVTLSDVPKWPKANESNQYLNCVSSKAKKIEYVEPACSPKVGWETTHQNKAASSAKLSNDDSHFSEDSLTGFETLKIGESHVSDARLDEVCFSNVSVRPELEWQNQYLSPTHPSRPTQSRENNFLIARVPKVERLSVLYLLHVQLKSRRKLHIKTKQPPMLND